MSVEEHFPEKERPRVKFLVKKITRLQKSLLKKQRKLHHLKYWTFFGLCLCIIPGLIPLIIWRVTYNKGLKENRMLDRYEKELGNLISKYNLKATTFI